MDPIDRMSVAPKSSTGQWIAKVAEYRELAKLENIFLNKVPYAILSIVAENIQSEWTQWEPLAQGLTSKKICSAKEFINCLSNKESPYRLQHLIGIARKLNHIAVKQCFTQCQNSELDRQQADNDLSKGYMRDISPETLADLSKLIAVDHIDWRLLADGLNFDNLSCLQLTSPHQMIQRWMEQNPKATVSRLQLECYLLKMNSIARYFDAIPLEGTPKVQLPPLPPQQLISRSVTCYDISRINGLLYMKNNVMLVDWRGIASHLCDYEFRQNKNMISDSLTEVQAVVAASEIIWQSSRVNLSTLLKSLEESPDFKSIVAKFKEEINDGLYEPVSPGGVTLTQVLHLASAEVNYRKTQQKEVQPKPQPQPQSRPGEFKNYGPGVMQFNGDPFELLSQMVSGFDSLGSDIRKLEKDNLPSMDRGSPINFKDFLILYWQSPAGRNLDLDSLSHKYAEMIDKSSHSNSRGVAQTLLDLYHQIKPVRSYDPVLAIANRQAEESASAKESAAKVNQISCEKLVNLPATTLEKEKDDFTCKICMERTINAVIDPCGHLGYCLECLKNLTMCPGCRGPIAKKIQVYRV